MNNNNNFLIFKRNHSLVGGESTEYRLVAPEEGMMED